MRCCKRLQQPLNNSQFSLSFLPRQPSIFTLTVTIEFIDSHDMRMKMKIMTDAERAKELGVSWANRKLWQTDLVVKTKFYNYKSRYIANDNVVKIEDNGSKMLLIEDGEKLVVDDSDMKATLKRIK